MDISFDSLLGRAIWYGQKYGRIEVMNTDPYRFRYGFR